MTDKRRNPQGLSERDAARTAAEVMRRVAWDGKPPAEALPASDFLSRIR